MAILTPTRLNIPQATRILMSSLVVISSFILFFKYKAFEVVQQQDPTGTHSYDNILVPFLQLVPKYAIFNPWVLVTAIFAEISIFSFLSSLVILYLGSKYCDKYWGRDETVKFVLVIGSITNLWTVLLTIVINLLTGDVKSMEKPLGGGISYYFAFLVVLKQLIPEHNLVLFSGAINFRVKHVPFALLVIVLLVSIFTKSVYPGVPSWGSFITSYVYLRFFQSTVLDPLLPTSSSQNQIGVQRITGDASDTFAFVEFFPDVVKPWLGPFFNDVYELAVTIGLISPFNEESIQQSNLRASTRVGRGKNTSNVAERRRQVALQVIEERINKESSS